MSKNITLWKGDTFKKVNRQEVIDRIIKYSKTDIEFSKLLKVIIGKIECFETVLVYNDGTIRILYEKGIYSYHTPRQILLKAKMLYCLKKCFLQMKKKRCKEKMAFSCY